MRRLSMVLTLAATAAFAQKPQAPLKLALPGLQGVNVSIESLAFFSEHLAAKLRQPGVTVITSREIGAVLGLERQRALLGCGETSSSCIAELANALGASGLVVGDVGKFGTAYQVNLKVLAADDGRVLAAESVRLSDEVQVLDALEALANKLVATLKGGPSGPAASSTVSVRTWSFIPGGLGVAAAITGAVLLGLAGADYQALVGSGAPLSRADANALMTGGTFKQTLGWGLLGGGVAALGAAVIMFLVGGASPAVSLAPMNGGFGVSVVGVF